MVDRNGILKANATIKDTKYVVVLTKRGASSSIWSARDTILNENTKEKKELTRKEWRELFKDYE